MSNTIKNVRLTYNNPNCSPAVQKAINDYINTKTGLKFLKEMYHVAYSFEPITTGYTPTSTLPDGTIVRTNRVGDGLQTTHYNPDTHEFSLTWQRHESIFDSHPPDPEPVIDESGLFYIADGHDLRLISGCHDEIKNIKPQKKYQSVVHLDFDTVLKLNEVERHAFKQQGKEWIHFKDASGHWDSTINMAFEMLKQDFSEMKHRQMHRDNYGLDMLSEGHSCVMGKTFDNGNPWSKDGYGWSSRHESRHDCLDCNWLANDGLHLFSNYGHRGMREHVKPTSKEGYEEYKAKWEYHMNTVHR